LNIRNLKQDETYDTNGHRVIEMKKEDSKVDGIKGVETDRPYTLFATFEPNQIKSVFNMGNFSNETADVYYQGAEHPLNIDYNYFFNRLYNEGIINEISDKKATIQKHKFNNLTRIDGKWVDKSIDKLSAIDRLNDEFIQYSGIPLVEHKDGMIEVNLYALKALRNSVEYKQKFSRSLNEPTTKILQQLQVQFGIPSIVVNDKNVEWKGKFENGVVFINEANFTEDTAFHEYAHPFLEVIEQRNPELFANLKNQLYNTKEGKAELNRVRSSSFYRDNTISEIEKEAMVSLIGKFAADNNFTTNKNLKYFLQMAFNRIYEYLKEALAFENGSKTVDISKLPTDLSLREVATVFNTDLKFDVSDGKNITAYSAATRTEEEDRLERLNEINNNVIGSLEAAIEDLNLLITEETSDIKKEKAVEELRSLVEHLKILDAQETFIELAKKAQSDLSKFDSWIADPTNFETPSPKVERKLILMQKYLTLYKQVDASEFAQDEATKTIVADINKFLKRVERQRRIVLVDYLTNYIESKTTNPNLKDNKSVIKKMLQENEDLSIGARFLGNLGSSKNTLLNMVDIGFKDKTNLLQEEAQETEILVGEIVDELIALNGGDVSNAFDYMINPENATVISKISNNYFERIKELNSELVDEDGVVLEYIVSDKLTDEEKAFNIDLAKKKAKKSQFLRAEIIRDGDPFEGENRKYSKKYISDRSYYQEVKKDDYTYSPKAFVEEALANPKTAENKKIIDGYYAFLNFYHKPATSFYSAEKTYNKATKTMNYTGNLKWNEDVRFVKDEFIEVKDLWNNKQYDKINKIDEATATPQQKVQKAFYNMYNDLFNESLSHLPKDVSRGMKGRIPSILKHTLDRFSDSESKFAFLKDGVTKSMLKPEIYLSGRTLDENGEVRRGAPIHYTNSLQSQKRIDDFEKKLSKLDKNKDKKEYDKISKQLYAEKSKPEPSDISTNLGSSILAFHRMASGYKAMNEYESFALLAKEQISKTKYISKNESGEQSLTDEGKNIFKKGKSLTEDRINLWLESVFYEMPEYHENKLGEVSKKLMNITSMRNLGLNPMSSLNNLITGAVFQNIEVSGGQYFDYSNYVKAGGEFTKYLATGVWKDLNQSLTTSKTYSEKRARTKMTAFARAFSVVEEQSESGQTIVKGESFLEKLW
jgi:hypothetical protein